MTPLLRLAQISWRNVFRNRRRSVLTLMILILGSTGLVVVGGFFESVKDRLRETYIHSSYGHLQINKTGFFERGNINPLEYLIGDFGQVQANIESESHVLYTAPRIRFGGMLSSNNSSLSVVALGVDPIREQRMNQHQHISSEQKSIHIVEGLDLDPKDPDGVIIGVTLLKALGLKVGDSVTFITTRNSGAIDGAEFKIRGTFETSLREVGERLIKMNLTTAQNILGIQDQVHTLLTILDRTEHTLTTRDRLSQKFKKASLPLEVITWEEQGNYYPQSARLMDSVYHTIQLIITIIFIFSIANTINMALFERMKEYGTMMAMGNSRRTIFALIIGESTLLGLIGGILGIGVAILVSQIISSVGIQMPPPPSINATGDFLIRIMWTPQLLLQTFTISMGATILSSLIPAYRASHFCIVKALGYV